MVAIAALSIQAARTEPAPQYRLATGDVIEIAAMYNFTNRLAMATGQLPNEEYHRLAR